MTFDLLTPLKFVFGREKERAPVPASSALVFDSRDVALFCMAVVAVFSLFAMLMLAARPLVIVAARR
jgi:hypothetical protein